MEVPCSYGKYLYQGALWEVVPEMRSAAAKACNALEATSFVEDRDREVGSEGGDALALSRGAAARVWCYRFTTQRRRWLVTFVCSSCQTQKGGRFCCGPGSSAWR